MDAVHLQVEDRVVALLRTAAIPNVGDRVFSEVDFRITEGSGPYVRVACPAWRRTGDRGNPPRRVLTTDVSLVVVLFAAATAETGDVRRYAGNLGASIRREIERNPYLRDDAGVSLAHSTLWQDGAIAVSGEGKESRAVVRQTFVVTVHVVEGDPTHTLPQLNAAI
jgi:hypothetical protein